MTLPFFGTEIKLTFSSPVATAEFSEFAGILSAALSQHRLLRLDLTDLNSVGTVLMKGGRMKAWTRCGMCVCGGGESKRRWKESQMWRSWGEESLCERGLWGRGDTVPLSHMNQLKLSVLS